MRYVYAISAAFAGLIITLPLLAPPAHARPSTKSFTCEGVRDFIYQRGAVVMDTKNSNVYRRFVKNRSFCVLDKVLFRFFAPTKTGNCKLYICRDPVFND